MWIAGAVRVPVPPTLPKLIEGFLRLWRGRKGDEPPGRDWRSAVRALACDPQIDLWSFMSFMSYLVPPIGWTAS